MSQALVHPRSQMVLLTAAFVSVAAWLYLATGTDWLPAYICGAAGYGPALGRWSPALMMDLVAMWFAMAAAMALPVAVVRGLKAERMRDAWFLVGHCVVPAAVALAAATLEWSLISSGMAEEGNRIVSASVAGGIFIVLGTFNLVLNARRRPAPCAPVRADAGRGAFAEGLLQGVASLSCSLTMTGIQFATGVMTVIVMVGLTFWMLLEAIQPERRELPIALGAALVLAGTAIMAASP